jgi:hypothetical protein
MVTPLQVTFAQLVVTVLLEPRFQIIANQVLTTIELDPRVLPIVRLVLLGNTAEGQISLLLQVIV